MLFLYDAYYNVKYHLTGVKNISDLLNNEEIVSKLGYSKSYIRKAYNERLLLKRIDKYILDEDVNKAEIFNLYRSQVHENEIWKKIEGYDGEHFISNHGRIKKVYKKYPDGKLLLPYPDKKVKLDKDLNVIKVKNRSNKMMVHLKNDKGERKEIIVSRLVGDYFLSNSKKSENISYGHLNGLFYDNHFENLVVMSKRDLGDAYGRHSRAKEVLKVDIDTGEILESYYSVREAGRQNFISYQAVLDNLNGKTKLACGEFLFKYESNTI